MNIELSEKELEDIMAALTDRMTVFRRYDDVFNEDKHSEYRHELKVLQFKLLNIYLYKTDKKTKYYSYKWKHKFFVLHVKRGKVRKRYIEYYKQIYTAQNNRVVVWKHDLKTNKPLKTYYKKGY